MRQKGWEGRLRHVEQNGSIYPKSLSRSVALQEMEPRGLFVLWQSVLQSNTMKTPRVLVFALHMPNAGKMPHTGAALVVPSTTLRMAKMEPEGSAWHLPKKTIILNFFPPAFRVYRGRQARHLQKNSLAGAGSV